MTNEKPPPRDIAYRIIEVDRPFRTGFLLLLGGFAAAIVFGLAYLAIMGVITLAVFMAL